MADERIDIEITDKVASTIAPKILEIANNARTANAHVNLLKKQLSSLKLNAVAQLKTTLDKNQTASLKTALANQKLATEQNKAALSAQRLRTEEQKTKTALVQTEAAMNRTALTALRLKNAQDRATRGSKSLGSSLMMFVRNAAAFVGIGFSAQAILNASDAYTTLQNKLKNVTDSEGQLEAVTQRVFEISNKTRTNVNDTAQAFQRFDLALMQLGASQEESLRLTETVNKSLITSGATAGEASSGLLQLSQAFNKGKLDGDEFRSVMELMPPVADAIAKQMGVTRGELLRLAPQGKITAEIMRQAFANVADEIDRKFGKTVPTLSQSMVVLKNNAVQAFGQINKSLGITAGISKVIMLIAGNMDILAFGVMTLSSALIVAFGPAFLSMMATATGAVWSFTAAIAANPIGLLIVGITSAISAIVIFGDKIKLTSDGVVNLHDYFKALFSYVTEWASKSADALKNSYASAIGWIESKLNKILPKTTTGRPPAMGGVSDEPVSEGPVMKRAREIANARIKTGSGTLRPAGIKPPALPDTKALKLAETRAQALAKVNRELNAELATLKNSTPLKAQDAKLTQIQNELANKKIKLNDKEIKGFKDKISQIQKAKETVKITEVNKELNDQISLLSKLGVEKSIQQQLNAIDSDFKKGDLNLSVESRKELESKIRLLETEKQIYSELGNLYSETTGAKQALVDKESALNLALKEGIVNQDQYAIRMNKLFLEASNLKLTLGEGSFTDVINTSLGSLTANYENVLTGLSSSFGSFFESLSTGFADSIGQAVVYSEDLGDALNNVAKQAVSGLISALVKLGIQYAVNAALGQSVGAAAMATQTAASVAAAGITAAAWAPAATMVSLASYGSNSVAAMAGIQATSLVAKANALGLGFEQGGYTGDFGKSQVAGVVHGREFVVNAAATAKNRAVLEAMNRGSSVSSASKSKGSASAGGVSVKIENYGTSKDFEVQTLTSGEIRIIARDEAQNAIKNEVPKVVAGELRNPNSRVSKSLNQNTQTQRRR